MRTRVTDLEGIVTRLGEDVASSHKRMEDMMWMILYNQGQKLPTAIHDTTEPSSLEQVNLSKAHEYQTYTKPSTRCVIKISCLFLSGMLFVVTSEMSTSTFAWTFALTDCDVSRFVWTSFETKQY